MVLANSIERIQKLQKYYEYIKELWCKDFCQNMVLYVVRHEVCCGKSFSSLSGDVRTRACFLLSRLEWRVYLTGFPSEFLTQGHIVGSSAQFETHAWLIQRMLGPVNIPLANQVKSEGWGRLPETRWSIFNHSPGTNARWWLTGLAGLVWFLCLMAYQLFLGYLMPKPFS